MEIKTKRLYRHFKGKYYYVHEIAKDSETNEDMVVYQAMYGEHNFFVRPLAMFVEKIDRNRVDNVTGQEYRFEICE